MGNTINLNDWCTPEQATQMLSQKKGQPVTKDYPRKLAERGKIRKHRLTDRMSLYHKGDINNFEFMPAGRPAKRKSEGRE